MAIKKKLKLSKEHKKNITLDENKALLRLYKDLLKKVKLKKPSIKRQILIKKINKKINKFEKTKDKNEKFRFITFT